MEPVLVAILVLVGPMMGGAADFVEWEAEAYRSFERVMDATVINPFPHEMSGDADGVISLLEEVRMVHGISSSPASCPPPLPPPSLHPSPSYPRP